MFCLNIRKYKNVIEKNDIKTYVFLSKCSVLFSYDKKYLFWVWFYDLLQRRLIVGRDCVWFRGCLIVEERAMAFEKSRTYSLVP